MLVFSRFGLSFALSPHDGSAREPAQQVTSLTRKILTASIEEQQQLGVTEMPRR